MAKKTKMPAHTKLFPREGIPPRNPAQVITLSFLAVILTGTVLLMMPFSSKSGTFTPFLSALFTATSATCVTGLSVYDTYTHFSIAGQGVIMALIQIGGLGLVTMTSFFYTLLRRKVGLRTAQLAQESISADTRSNTLNLLRMVVGVTFITELLGATAMLPIFFPKYGSYGIFMSVFLAISAYCNAGFDLFGLLSPGASLIPVRDNIPLLLIISALVICGGLGFIVWQDLLVLHRKKKFQFHTRVVLFSTAVLLFGGTLLFLLLEWNNPDTIGKLPFAEKLANAFFQSVTCRTAGFTTFDQGALRDLSKVFSIILMFIGAAPGSTGGGIKLTTALLLFMTVVSVIRGDEETTLMNRRIEKQAVYRSLAVTFLGLCIVLLTSGIILIAGDADGIIDAVYEAVSGFATVGLTCGVTDRSGVQTKLALILTMYLGRVGPVAFALSLSMRPRTPGSRMRQLPEGKLWVA